jgi:hypothetical protein
VVAALSAAACTGALMDPSPLVDAGLTEPSVDAAGPPPEIDAAAVPALDGGSLAERPCPQDSFLSYQSFGAPFMWQYCTGCHSSDVPENMRQEAPLGVDFETAEQVREHMERIYARAADSNTTMPPGGGPDPEARTLLGEWLACGAP